MKENQVKEVKAEAEVKATPKGEKLFYVSLAQDKAPRKGCSNLTEEGAIKITAKLLKRYPQRTYHTFEHQAS